MKFIPLLLIVMSLLFLGCSNELSEAYGNTKEWVDTKNEQTQEAIESIQDASEEVQEAASSVSDALEDVETVIP